MIYHHYMKKITTNNIALTAFFLLVFSFQGSAQETKWKGWGIAELGWISGTYEVSGDIRLQGGIQKNGWNIGLGTGVDYYRFTSFPIYAQGRKFIGKGKNKPFILTSIGINIPSEARKDLGQPMFFDAMNSFRAPSSLSYFYDMGIYTELGGGFAFLNKKGRGLLLSLSYTQKRIKESTTNYYYLQGIGEPTEDVSEYIMNRAALRIGYKF